MSDTTFVAGTVVTKEWLNDVNDVIYGPTSPAGTFRDDLANTSGATLGSSLIGWLRAATSSVATTVKSFLGWQEINAFEFMTVAEIAAFQALDNSVDHSTALQAWINACASTKQIGRLPAGAGRVGTTLTVPTGVVLRGHGIFSQLRGWGVSVFQITGDHASIEDMYLAGYTSGGVSDPRAQDAIDTNGVLATKNNYLRLKRLFLQGWNRAINLRYVDNSVIDDVTTINTNIGVRFYGQCVNNSIINSRLVCNSGVASIQTSKNGADSGEGLTVTNCLLASGQNAFLSDAFLAVGFYNCVADLLTEYAFDCTQVGNFVFNGPWVYSAKRCFQFQNPGAPFDLDANINVGLATTTGASEFVLVMAANNVGLVLSGTYYLSNASGSTPMSLSGSQVTVGAVRIRNATTNSDIQVNGTNIRISQEAYLPNGLQNLVSQIRSVASGTTTTLPVPTGAQIERISITGNTGCTNLNDPLLWQGKIVVLVFTGTPTWTDGGNLTLAGNFVATASDTLTLVSDGTAWVEMCRSAN